MRFKVALVLAIFAVSAYAAETVFTVPSTIGQRNMAGSTPVTIASDQASIPVRASFATPIFDGTTAALGAGATWISGTFDSANGQQWLSYSAYSTTSLQVWFDESTDGVTWSNVDPYLVNAASGNYASHKLSGRYGRVRILNGATPNAGGVANLNIMVSSASVATETDVTVVDKLGNNLGAFAFRNISTALTATLKTGGGVLHIVCNNTSVNGATIQMWDSTVAASGVPIALISPPNNSSALNCFTYDLQFVTGLTVTTVGTANWTITYN